MSGIEKGKDTVAIILSGKLALEPSDQQYHLINVTIPDTIKMFLSKNRDYGDTSIDLGIKGQYAEIHRKVGKLKQSMWLDKELSYEQTDEILKDLIGHCLLSLYFLDLQDGKEAMAMVQEDAVKQQYALVKRVAELFQRDGLIYTPATEVSGPDENHPTVGDGLDESAR